MSSSSIPTFDTTYPESDQKSSFGMFVLIGLIFVLIGRVQEIFNFLIPLRLGIVFQILAVPVIIRLAKQNQFKLLSLEALEWKLLLGLWCTGIVSTLFSNYKMVSIIFIMMSFPVVMLFFILTVNIIKTFDDLRKIVFSFVFTIVFLSVPALTSGSARWASLGANYDPNDIALIIVVTIPFAFCLIDKVKGVRKLFFLAAVLVFIMAIFATLSRGGFLGLVAVLAVLLYRANSLNFLQKGGVVLVLLLLFSRLAPDSFKDRLVSIGSEEDYNVSDTYGRKAIWERNIPIVHQNPILGVGPGCFTIVNGFTFAEEFGGKSWNMTAHNSYLLVAVEMGLVGLGLYVAFIVRCIMRMQHLQKDAVLNPEIEEHIWFATALEASLFGYMVSALFLSFTYNPVLYLLVGLGVAYGNIIATKKLANDSGQEFQIKGQG